MVPARPEGLIVFAAGDAGPAAYLAEIMTKIKVPYHCVSSPVSARIFNARGIVNTPFASAGQAAYDDLVQRHLETMPCSLIVTGTSWGDCVDKAFIAFGTKNGIRVVSVIEHWSWFRERFMRNGKLVLPDNILVNDERARKVAIREGLPADRIYALGNPVLENSPMLLKGAFDKREYRESLGIRSNRIITFISEDYAMDFPAGSYYDNGFDEYRVLEDILSVMDTEDHLLIKLHPAEAHDKYDRYKQKNVAVVARTDSAKLVACSDFIIGMGSMLLLEAALVRDDVISYRPCGDKIGFVGNDIGATFLVEDTVVLHDLLEGRIRPGNKAFGHAFQGSTERILSFLRERIQ